MTCNVIARIAMPIVLTREMTPNGRYQDFNAQKAVTRRLREDARRATVSHTNDPACRAAIAALKAHREPLVMDIEIAWPPRRKRLDDDNAKASLKPILDGMADELWGGSDAHVRVGTVSQIRGDGGLAFTFRADEGQP